MDECKQKQYSISVDKYDIHDVIENELLKGSKFINYITISDRKNIAIFEYGKAG